MRSAPASARRPKAEKEAAPERAPSPAKAAAQAKKQIAALDEKIARLTGLLTRIDAALVDPNAYSRDKNKASQLAAQRKDLARALETAEDEWLALTTLFEAAAE